MSLLEALNPERLGAPRGYSNGILAPAGGRLLFVAGQIAWDDHQRLVSTEFTQQFDQALGNVLAVVEEAGGQAEHIARLTLYVTDKADYLAALGAIGESYRRHMGRHYPAMSLVQVADLLEEGAQVEIEATAVLPA
ncbi:MAG: RidA family protein [Acidobacteriota bacterium]